MNTHIAFPVNLPASWHQPSALNVPDPCLKDWLLNSGSLTERLQAHSRRFALRVIGQQASPLSEEEVAHMALAKASVPSLNTLESKAWQVREVVLYGDDSPWVFARSILPEGLCETALSGLGEKPLGQLIFNNNAYQRSSFEISQLPASHPLLTSLGLSSSYPLWARRSRFFLNSFSMSVAEVFLPGAPAYKYMEPVT